MADGIAAKHNRGGKVNEVPTTAVSAERQTMTRNQSTAIRCRKQSTRCIAWKLKITKIAFTPRKNFPWVDMHISAVHYLLTCSITWNKFKKNKTNKDLVLCFQSVHCVHTCLRAPQFNAMSGQRTTTKHVKWLNEHNTNNQPEHNFSTFVQPPKGEHLNIVRKKRREYEPINDTLRERLSI